MGRQEEFKRIHRLISRWVTEIRLNNALDLYDINRIAEDIARCLLNEIYNYNLVNLNYEQRNYPGIDLGDKENKTGFQITSRGDAGKIRDCLQKFKKKGTKKFSKGIRFLILKNEKLKFSEKQEKVFKDIYPGFDPAKHILTVVDLTRDILLLYDNQLKRFREVKKLLEKEFADRVKEEDGLSLLERLYNGSRRYYKSLTGVNGRFKHLDIADIILPRPERKSKQEWIDTRVAVEIEDQRHKDEVSVNVLDALPQLWEQECKHTVLVGEGGMGKTVSLVRLWKEYTRAEFYVPGSPVPVFIQLNEWNRWAERNQKNFINWMIRHYYLDDAVEEKEIQELMKQPVKNGDSFVPSVILMLDGFNEITAEDRSPLLLELRDLMEGFPDVQMVVTSRYDMRGNLNWGQFHLMHLLKLSDDQVKGYLKSFLPPAAKNLFEKRFLDFQKLFIKRDVGGERLLELISNPMMLTIYASTCEVEKEHRESRNYAFKERVETPGELLLNFIESQVARLFERKDKPEEEQWFYRFLLKCLLPAVGFEMEKMGRFDMTPSELDEIFLKYFNRFCQKDFLSVFRDYRNCVKRLNVKEWDDLEVMDRIEGILKIFVKELCMLVKEGESFRFLHQNFRDYFAAVHILNETAIGLEKKEIPEVLKERTLPVYLLRFLGEIEGEHYCKPVLNKENGWEIKENKESKLFQMLDLCRGCFDGSLGYGVWNIVVTKKVARGELSGMDLSRLDLFNVVLNGVQCSRFYGDEYLFAVFDESLFNEDNLFPQGHSNAVNTAVYNADGKKILSASGDGTFKEWDVATSRCLKTYRKDDPDDLDRLNDSRQSKEGTEILEIKGKEFFIKNKTTNNTIRTFTNIPGLLVQGCSFKNLHPRSKMSEKSKQLLKMYGAVVE
ncbi:MAG: SMEK domain-containing protein [Candidatus Aminicenantes bacterium]|nr:SMEK domain-containing protein [Candidatus Aminicenantes bacterium]NIM79733.1 SMEK domain-containing protein [Candidatus Aminicenantes bacterium]NIN19064.1 SMEK domain-containing protein [Candidatus Aminicenantes bacterium]NIN42966.1 SMEK domain-containing protein [Candidatus Aminicenantes bacterium]NIN85709.1 SMEK domain-containing protein [Candidatus Aminicenantes bacterium]